METNLAILLAMRKTSIKELSQKTGISKNTLYAIRNEKKKGLKMDTINRICAVLECSVSDLLDTEKGVRL